MPDEQRIKDEQSTLKRAQVLGLHYIDTSRIEKTLYKDIFTLDEIKNNRIVPIKADKNSIVFGITNTTPRRFIEGLNKRFVDQEISFGLISEPGYREYLLMYDPPKKIEYADIQINSEDPAQLLEEVSQTLSQVRPDDMLAYIVQQAFRLKASDIHLESKEVGSRIRLRVHGVLHTVAHLDADRARQFLSVLASAANISTAADQDQTGHINRQFRLATGEMVTVNLRVETVPAVNGIDAVLRLFNFNADRLHISKLGLSEKQSAVIKDIISHPSGMVLIVGPTGSGKTTTLYSILNELNTDERKIITLEDPVEYQIDGISQIPVRSRKGQTFADKFRAVMRLDPDVIMVGEIRDLDTAKTALQAALTGHLVLSTYHASSSAAALTRLLDAIGENPVYASAIRLIQSQRLVRRLDDATKKPTQPSPELQKHLNSVIEGIHADVDLSFLSSAQLYEPGSSPENPFGFSGQIAIRELMVMTPNLQKLLMHSAKELTTDVIQQTAVQDGMLTMHQDGVLKALRGLTTYQEIARVVD